MASRQVVFSATAVLLSRVVDRLALAFSRYPPNEQAFEGSGAFNTTWNVLILLYPVGALTVSRVILPPGFGHIASS